MIQSGFLSEEDRKALMALPRDASSPWDAMHRLSMRVVLTRIFHDTLFEVLKIGAQLFERKTQSKQAFDRVARQIVRETVAAKRGDLGTIAVEGRIASLSGGGLRRAMSTGTSGRPASGPSRADRGKRPWRGNALQRHRRPPKGHARATEEGIVCARHRNRRRDVEARRWQTFTAQRCLRVWKS
jgi:hypothetical protein